jgi:hypothetical protein
MARMLIGHEKVPNVFLNEAIKKVKMMRIGL